ncbi:MAG: hypothetical protein KF788_08790 [Piscinibacter sp.]|nr:hypothetical protein [Piscinibacter sp.]
MRIAILLLIAPLLALLQACSSAPVALEGRALTLAPLATATLATNACEAATAAGYTQTIHARKQIPRKLASGAWTASQARSVQTAADQARAALDTVCTGSTVNSVMLILAGERVKNLRDTLEALP